MKKSLPISAILLTSIFVCACATKHAGERTGKHLAYKAKEIESDKVLEYQIAVREPKTFTVGYQAKMIVGEFAKDDTFNIKYQGKLYIPKAAQGLVNINADYESKIYWCDGKNIGTPVAEEPTPSGTDAGGESAKAAEEPAPPESP
ncbi:MAG: hypothetical protein GY847_24620 [Proteobacteria bacterium]|nr:hypothetical protein [Pseudomonadota bacterium]